ncbi:MAG: fasciclin domain-containing protein [Desulfobaccales bacterium]
MRIKIALMTLLLVMFSAGIALSQAPVSMYDTLAAAGNFKTFLSAVDKANVQELKKMPGNFTLFAPTDEAFAKLPAGTMDKIMDSSARVQDLVYYHITPGKYYAKDLPALKECKTMCPTDQPQLLKLTKVGDKYMVGTASIVKPDVVASNGIIQVIDAVLMPTWAPKSNLPPTTK